MEDHKNHTNVKVTNSALGWYKQLWHPLTLTSPGRKSWFVHHTQSCRCNFKATDNYKSRKVHS